MQTLIYDIKNMFHSMGKGNISPSAYDTAWVARIRAIHNSSQPQFPQTLQWVVSHQFTDGSWGEQSFYLLYDRLLCTLACLITLTIWRVQGTQMQKGIDFVNNQTQQFSEGKDCNMPLGFVILFSSMLKEAHSLGLGISHESLFIKRIFAMRKDQLKGINISALHSLPTSFFFYLEGLQEFVDWKKIMDLLSKDGSVAGSPASTACAFMHTRDGRCLDFITSVVRIFKDHVPGFYPCDLRERLRAVHTVEHLGIGRHFEREIKDALDYIYRHWTPEGIGRGRHDSIANINDTALGFRILRLHEYDVSSEVISNFMDENGEFFSYSDKTHRDLEGMLSLYKCSQVAFPGEKLMKEAEAFAVVYLQQNLKQLNHFPKLLVEEVKYELKFGFHRSLPRLEARTYIDICGRGNEVFLGKTLYKLPYVNNEKYVELAKVDFNAMQSIHQMELQQVHKWWIDSGFRTLKFTRERHNEIFFTVAASMFEPEFGRCRMAFTKIGCLLVVLDDLYDKYGSRDDIMLFNEAFARWDLNTLDGMPDHIKVCFLGLYNTVNDLADEAGDLQGRDMLQYFKNLWKIQLDAFSKEAEWSKQKYVPSWNEYLDVAKVSVGFATEILTLIHLIGEVVTDNILRQIDERSKSLHLVCLTARLINDTKTYKAERDLGELASAIECYRKDNPEVAEEAALGHVYGVIQDGLIELNEELFKFSQLPIDFKNLLLNSARLMQLVYMRTDAFNTLSMTKKGIVDKCLFEGIV